MAKLSANMKKLRKQKIKEQLNTQKANNVIQLMRAEFDSMDEAQLAQMFMDLQKEIEAEAQKAKEETNVEVVNDGE